VLPTFHKGGEKIEVKVQQVLPQDMVKSLPIGPMSRDKDVNKKYRTTSSLIYIARNLIYIKIHVLVVHEICGNVRT
jgi:hypothetical protein